MKRQVPKRHVKEEFNEVLSSFSFLCTSIVGNLYRDSTLPSAHDPDERMFRNSNSYGIGIPVCAACDVKPRLLETLPLTPQNGL